MQTTHSNPAERESILQTVDKPTRWPPQVTVACLVCILEPCSSKACPCLPMALPGRIHGRFEHLSETPSLQVSQQQAHTVRPSQSEQPTHTLLQDAHSQRSRQHPTDHHTVQLRVEQPTQQYCPLQGTASIAVQPVEW